MEATTQPSAKIDVYQIVTNRIIELLEAGTVPWQKPWADGGMPRNLISKRPYRGINLWLLLSLSYEQNLFLTWDQLKHLGASVNQGEHGHIVVFWKNVNKIPEELDGQGNPKMIPMLRYYKVFNVAQCRDVPEEMIPDTPKEIFRPIDECERIIREMPNPPQIVHKENRACYYITKDIINMPRKKTFESPESYYGVLFHELVHSTGSEKRLDRKTVTEMHEFGSSEYCIEELIAEIGSSYLSAHSNILHSRIDQSTAYISNWLQQLKNDKRLILKASGQAQLAADLILTRE